MGAAMLCFDRLSSLRVRANVPSFLGAEEEEEAAFGTTISIVVVEQQRRQDEQQTLNLPRFPDEDHFRHYYWQGLASLAT